MSLFCIALNVLMCHAQDVIVSLISLATKEHTQQMKELIEKYSTNVIPLQNATFYTEDMWLGLFTALEESPRHFVKHLLTVSGCNVNTMNTVCE